ncbi:hypothetical protein EIP86_010794 [Pleurotus ostreatoroseus]|nr:hypothetical protein EIP86_010794 [Pleurotus ostreatoroseus]
MALGNHADVNSDSNTGGRAGSHVASEAGSSSSKSKHARFARIMGRQDLYEQSTQEHGRVKVRGGRIICDEPEEWYLAFQHEPRPRRRRLLDFQVIRTLGQGGEGKVVAIRNNPLDHYEHKLDYPSDFAAKIIKKLTVRTSLTLIVARTKEKLFNVEDFSVNWDHFNRPLRIHGDLPWNPFLSSLVDIYVDTRNLYYVTELAPLGSFVDFLASHAPLRPMDAQFYFGNITAALEFLHSEGIVHGDVKPDNIYMGADGYLLLGDFGHAREEALDYGSWNGCGTLHYQPPECLELSDGISDDEPKRAHGRYADWWGAACVLFEMATREIAFPLIRSSLRLRRGIEDDEGANKEVMERICGGELLWPKRPEVDEHIKDLVSRMLVPNPDRRYGVTQVPPEAPPPPSSPRPPAEQVSDKNTGPPHWKNMDIRRHPFMTHFPWKALKNRTMVAPHVPNTKPDLRKSWQDIPLPEQYEVPYIPIRNPPSHLKYDDRFEWEDKPKPHKRRRVDSTPPDHTGEDRFIEQVREQIEARKAQLLETRVARPNLQEEVAVIIEKEAAQRRAEESKELDEFAVASGIEVTHAPVVPTIHQNVPAQTNQPEAGNIPSIASGSGPQGALQLDLQPQVLPDEPGPSSHNGVDGTLQPALPVAPDPPATKSSDKIPALSVFLRAASPGSPEGPAPLPGPSSSSLTASLPCANFDEVSTPLVHRLFVPLPDDQPDEDTAPGVAEDPEPTLPHTPVQSTDRALPGPRQPRLGRDQPGDDHSPRRPARSPERSRLLKRKASDDEE